MSPASWRGKPLIESKEKPEGKMYLHLGQQTTVKTKEIIGIFDLDTTTLSKKTRDFLQLAEQRGQVINATNELPKSFTVTSENGSRVYICQPTAQTLKKRADTIILEYKTFKKERKL
ncbi:MAG: extracellular matrix regulator RemB [Saezia sp.]